MQVRERILYYVHDPMCSWCWAFRPTWRSIVSGLQTDITVEQLLGGLAADTDQPMPVEMQANISSIWRTIQTRVPGIEFNFDFWRICQPRRSTYPACRAAIAAKLQGKEYEDSMILSIQEAYYLFAKNPSDDNVLVELAAALGMDIPRFTKDLNAPETQQRLVKQITLAQQMGVRGFPSLVLKHHGTCQRIHFDYNDPAVVLSQLGSHA